MIKIKEICLEKNVFINDVTIMKLIKNSRNVKLQAEKSYLASIRSTAFLKDVSTSLVFSFIFIIHSKNLLCSLYLFFYTVYRYKHLNRTIFM